MNVLVDQIAAELAQRWAGFAAADATLADAINPAAIGIAAGNIAARLETGDADTAALLLPSDRPGEWWTTPVGLVCAAAIGDRSITRTEAAQIVGKTVDAVKKAAQRGVYGPAAPDGGLRLGRVLAEATTRGVAR
ncbi:MAG: hypothetical protein GY929_23355 [Actinomycetia bacterium]|nr:hypothetical protein [Actinomycetes bacterium]